MFVSQGESYRRIAPPKVHSAALIDKMLEGRPDNDCVTSDPAQGQCASTK